MPLDSVKFTLGDEVDLYSNQPGLLVKKVSQKVKRKLGFFVCSWVDAVVPSFYIIVCAVRNHEDGPTGRGPHGAEKPNICHILDKLLEKRRHCLDSEPLKDYNVCLWQERKCHNLSYVLVNKWQCLIDTNVLIQGLEPISKKNRCLISLLHLSVETNSIIDQIKVLFRVSLF